MIIRVKMFAMARELAGGEVLEMELPEGATIADLRKRLADQRPQLASLVKHVLFAIGTEYATDATRIPSGADVACIPPVSGG